MTRLSTSFAMLLASGCLSFHAGPMDGEPADATYASVEGARVRFVDEGEGPAVVLIHGFASSLETWEGVRPALRERHRVVALDLKGFGWTDRPRGDYSPAAQARLVLALMDARGIERAALVAHSWGSSVALQLALEAPERVTRLALYDAYVYPEQRNTFFQWADADGMGEILFGLFYDQRPEERIALAFFDPDSIPQALIDAIERAAARPGTGAAALAAARGMQAFESSRYGDVRAPILLLWGREDRVTPLSYGERLQNELADARLRVYPRCGHFPMIEAARPSLRDLSEFLAAEVEQDTSPTLRAAEPPRTLEPAPAQDGAPDEEALP
ncbi:MAG: alpha/beta fold hydrolase [Sandaracinaceae bacterium]|nr:alpha/beta fold hydrolase [Sandaracinaceae bacterium]